MVQKEIYTKNVIKTYRSKNIIVNALKSTNICINTGEYISIIGTSGSGKSTLLNLLGCLDKPSSGSLFIRDVDISKLEDEDLALIRRHHIGFIFQRFHLISMLNALENVELAMRFSPMLREERQNRAMELLKTVGLSNRLDHVPSELSGGEQQRVAIARALSNNPSIILADEPTGNLDSSSGKMIMNLLERIHREGKTVIVVTHDMTIARRAERIFHISDGLVGEFHDS